MASTIDEHEALLPFSGEFPQIMFDTVYRFVDLIDRHVFEVDDVFVLDPKPVRDVHGVDCILLRSRQVAEVFLHQPRQRIVGLMENESLFRCETDAISHLK